MDWIPLSTLDQLSPLAFLAQLRCACSFRSVLAIKEEQILLYRTPNHLGPYPVRPLDVYERALDVAGTGAWWQQVCQLAQEHWYADLEHAMGIMEED